MEAVFSKMEKLNRHLRQNSTVMRIRRTCGQKWTSKKMMRTKCKRRLGPILDRLSLQAPIKDMAESLKSTIEMTFAEL